MPDPDPTDELTRNSPASDTGRSGSADRTGPIPPPGCPERIGRYEVRAVLGEGAYGRVYRAHDPELRREVAIKVPHPQGLTPAVRERFLREARAAATVQHPNVCPIYDVGTDGDLPFIVMRLVPGRTLADVLTTRPALPPRHAASVARKLALGVAAAHAAGVIHRDLKPQNVLWDEANRQVFVTDFGLARVGGEAPLTSHGDILGTPSYMAPEQARGDLKTVGPLSDVYALGVTLYRMLAGEPPYTGTAYEVMIQAVEGNPRPPSAVRPGLDPALDAICLKAMAVNPADRYPSARAFADTLGEYLEGSHELPIAETLPPAPQPRPPRPAPRPLAGVPVAPARQPPPPRPHPDRGPPPDREGEGRGSPVRLGLMAVGCGGLLTAAVVGVVVAVVTIGGGRPPATGQTEPTSPTRTEPTSPTRATTPATTPATKPATTPATSPTRPTATTPTRPSPPVGDPGAADLRQVMAALKKYDVARKGLPPAAINAPDDTPLLSWRVALLPYLGHDDLYRRFQLDRPWNDLANRRLIPLMPAVYKGSLPGADGRTAFKAFVGGRAAFDRWDQNPSAVLDGAANTFAVAEAGDPVEWTRPEDIPYDGKTPPRLVPPGGGDALLVGLLDGTVRRLSLSKNPADVIRKGIDTADGDAAVRFE